MKFTLDNLKQLGIIVLLFLIVYVPLAYKYSDGYPGVPYTDDLRSHVFNAFSIHQNPFAHIYPTLYSGSVLYQFYSIVPYYVGLPFTYIENIPTATKQLLGVAVLIALLSMWIASYKLYRNFTISTVAATAYVWFSYFTISLQSRGAIGEMFGYALFPLAMVYFMMSLEEWNKKYIVYTIIFSALIILSSVPVAWMLAFSFVVYMIYHTCTNKAITKNLVKTSAIVLIGILALTAFWLIPFLSDMKQMNFQDFYTNGKSTIIGMPGNTGLSLNQLFGYHFGILPDGTRAFYIGYSLIILSLLGVLFYRSRVYTCFAALVLIMILVPATLNFMPMASSLQFSFRLLMLVGFGMAMSAGIVTEKFSKYFKKEWIFLAVIAVIILDFFPNLNQPWANQPAGYFVNTAEQVNALQAIKIDPEQFLVFSPTTQVDYLYTEKFGLGWDWEGLKQGASDKIWSIYTAYAQAFIKGNINETLPYLGAFGVKYVMLPCNIEFEKYMKLVYSNGQFCDYLNYYYKPLIETTNGTITNINIIPDRILFTANMTQVDYVLVKIFNFEGHWNYYIDEINKGQPETLPNLPYMLITVPKGYHNIDIKYHKSNIQNTTAAISLLSLFALIYWRFKSENKCSNTSTTRKR